MCIIYLADEIRRMVLSYWNWERNR